MPRKNTVNFAQTILTAPSSGITTLIGTVGTSDTFPATNFYATIQQVVAGEIIKKEVVLCSTRTGTTFSVTRGQDGTSAQDFTTGGGIVYLVIATASAHIQDIRDKLDTVDTDIDAVEVKPATGKTTPVDADSMRLWDSVASNVKKFVTWVNVKATLKTYFDTLYHTKNALRTGLTASKTLITDGSGNEGYADLPSSVVKLAGENINAGDALRMGYPLTGDSLTAGLGTLNNLTFRFDTTSYWIGQQFVTINGGLLTNIQVNLLKVGSPTGTVSCKIYNAAGNTLLYTSTNTINQASITTGYVAYNFTFNNVELFPSTTYRFLFDSGATVSTTNYLRVGDTNNTYAGGEAYKINNALTWILETGRDIGFVMTMITNGEILGRVHKASANLLYKSYVVGFALNTNTTGNNITLDMEYTDKITGLTRDTVYYLSNTPGAISTTAGTVSRVVGRSISTTELLINLFG